MPYPSHRIFAGFMTTMLLLSCAVFLAACDKSDSTNPPSPAAKANVPPKKKYNDPPPMTIDVKKTYIATIDTNKGKITLELFAKDAPLTVNNFVFLAREGFYDGLTFHRVVADFMIQGGDPKGDGSGGPGYEFADETTDNPREFRAGSLAMANRGPRTNGSQFFINHVPTPHLQGKHTIFGQVADAESQKVVNSIQVGDVMKKVTIEELAN